MLAAADLDWNNAWGSEDWEGAVRKYARSFVTTEAEASALYDLCKKLHRNGWKAGKASVQGKIVSALGIRGVSFNG